jgi:hypothetical protein
MHNYGLKKIFATLREKKMARQAAKEKIIRMVD